MPSPRWKLALTPLAVLGLASPLLASCHESDTPVAAAPTDTTGLGGVVPVCDEVKTGDFSTLEFARGSDSRPPGFGENVKRLLGQASLLAKTAAALEQGFIDACTELGLAAGVLADELKASPDAGHGAEKACNAAATKVSSMFRQAKEAKILLDLSIEPTRCFVDVEAARKCLADCGAPVIKGDIRAQCTGGEIDGACSGRCSGSCALSAGAGAGLCHAVCSGKCDHDFRGTCGGKCSGTCDGAPTRGPRHCSGLCDGGCDKGEGVCAGRCDGACSGGWEPPPTGRCGGICVGVCSSEVSAPLCSGEYAPPGVDPVCQAACSASSALASRCDAPLVRVSARGAKPTPALEKLLAGLQSAVPRIIRLQRGPAKKVPRAIEGAVTAAVDWSNAYATAGPRPLFCVRSSIDAMKEASGWIELALRGTEAIAPAIKTDPPPQLKGEDE